MTGASGKKYVLVSDTCLKSVEDKTAVTLVTSLKKNFISLLPFFILWIKHIYKVIVNLTYFGL